MELVAIECTHCKHENRNQLPDNPKPDDIFFCVACDKPADSIWHMPITTAIWTTGFSHEVKSFKEVREKADV